MLILLLLQRLMTVLFSIQLTVGAEPHVMMLYRSVDVVATAAIDCGNAEHPFDDCRTLDAVCVLNPMS